MTLQSQGIVLLAEALGPRGDAALVDTWFEETRVSELKSSGVFKRVCRLQSADQKSPRWLTLLECEDVADPATAYAALPAAMPIGGLTEVGWGAFLGIGGLADTGVLEHSKGLLIGLTNCPDKHLLEAYHTWYEQVHAADVIGSPFYQRVRRFEQQKGTLAQFAALYDTEGEEPTTFQDYLAWPERNPTMSDAADVQHVWTFNQIGAYS